MKNPKDAKFVPMTYEEIAEVALEQMREETIMKMVSNEVKLDALRATRMKSGKDSDLQLVNAIRDREALSIDLPKDLETVESYIEKLKAGEKIGFNTKDDKRTSIK